MTATATDNAGRTATAQRSYTVDPWTLSSFGQPVTPTANGAAGDDIKWNVMKSGRAVPLKFTIFAGATELTSTNAVKSFKAHNVGCNGAAGSGGLDLIGDNDTNAGNTTLRFDTDERQFIQNWKTPKVNADTCYRVVVETQDGNETQAYFRLTR